MFVPVPHLDFSEVVKNWLKLRSQEISLATLSSKGVVLVTTFLDKCAGT